MLTRRGLIAGALACSASLPLAAQEAAPVVTVYRSASCGCCGAWVDHMKKAGFQTKVVTSEDLAARKREFGVPDAAESCHTAMVDGYFVEGHVPAADVRRLLRRNQVQSQVIPRENGSYVVELRLRDDVDSILHLELTAATEAMARDLADRFRKDPEGIYTRLLSALYPPAE